MKGYLNTDLILKGSECSDKLAQALSAAGVHELGRWRSEVGSWRIVFELSPDPKTPLDSILRILDAIESLPASVLGDWERCQRRVLDFGFRSAQTREPLEFSVEPLLLNRMAALSLELAVTVYHPDK